MFVVGPDETGQLFEPEDAERSFHRPRRHAAKLGVGRLLVVVDMAAGLTDELVPRPAMDAHADLVRHCAGRNKQRRLLAQQLRQPGLQPQHRRVFTEHVVAHFGRRHRGPHGRRGLGERVAAEIEGAKGVRHGDL